MRPAFFASAFLKHGSQFLLAHAGAAILALAANVALARALAPAELGRLTAANAWFWWVVLGCGLGTPTALGRMAATAKGPLQILRLAAGLGGLAAVVLGTTCPNHALPLVAAAMPALAVQLLATAALAQGDLPGYRLLQWLPVAVLAGTGWLTWGLAWPALAWWGSATSQLVAATVGFFRAWRRGPGPGRPGATTFRRSFWRNDLAVVASGVPVVVGQLVVSLSLRGDLLVLGQVAPWASVARYGVAKQLAERVGLFAQATAPLAFASTVAAPKEVGHTPLACRLTALVSFAGAGVLAAGAPFLIPRFFGADYAKAVPLTWLLLGGGACANVGNVAAGDLHARGQSPLVLGCSLVGLASQAAALLCLVRPFGICGAAAASTLANAVEATAKLLAFARLTNTPCADLWRPRAADLEAVAASWRLARVRPLATLPLCGKPPKS